MRKRSIRLIGLVWILAAHLASSSLPLTRPGVLARPVAEWPQIDVTLVESGFESPIHVTHAGDGSDRLFVVEQRGRIQIVKAGELLQEPFLDISERVLSKFSGGGGEEGLLSVAFPPGYGTDKDYFYVYYTRKDGENQGDNQLSRFSLGPDADTADPDSEEPILLFDHPTYGNHNGGQLAFGPEGYLYIGTGDGGGGGDPFGNAQDKNSLLGKLLRIDVEFGVTGGPVGEILLYFPFISNAGSEPPELLPYKIPDTNPYAGSPGVKQEIWALGLRNPWRLSFDRLTGDLYTGDVGQSTREEVNFQPGESSGGENYGWPIFEGDSCFQAINCDDSGLIKPVAVYSTHVNGTCAVTGGFVYRGQDHPSLQGIYFFGDYCNGTIRGLQQESGTWTNQILLSTGLTISTFGEDESGELFLTDYQGGAVYQLVETGSQSEK